MRTLFVLVTVLCVWIGYQLNWIRERREAREFLRKNGAIWPQEAEDATAPLGLRIFGEQGFNYFYVGTPSNSESFNREDTFAKLRRLFPEAKAPT